jgi:arylsulfatase A-like enzyme
MRYRPFLCATLLLAGCRGGEVPGGYLLDGGHQPDVLVESRKIALTPETSGNRVLSGWWPWRRKPGDAVQLLPVEGEGRFEITTLVQRPRSLVLDLSVAEGAVGRRVGLRVAGRSVPADLQLEPRMEIPLPRELPLGRVAVDVYLGNRDVAVREAAIRPTLPPGQATIDNRDLLQSGASLVDLVRPLGERATRLVGHFVPPEGAGNEQEFHLLVQREGEAAESPWAWKPTWWRPDALGTRIDIDLPAGERFVRIRLLALGDGPAGRWQGLRLVEAEDPAPVEAAADVFAPPSSPRIVVLYVMDALRADHIGHLGGPEGISPTIDRLASEGTTFTNYLTVAPNTVPSVKTLFSGRVYLQGGTRRLEADAVTLAERFGAAGYGTALLTGNGNISPSRGLTRGFDFAPSGLLVAGDPVPSEVLYNDNAERCHRSALAWLDGVRPEKAFLHIQTIHPHNPYNPPRPYVERYAAGTGSTIDGRTRTLLDIRQQRRDVDAEDEKRIAGLYAGAVAYNDRHLADFLAALLERYPGEEILFIFTSDHGDELFDHGGVLHGYTLYEEQLHVPLVFWWPGRIPPQRLATAVDTLDLHYSLATLVSEPGSVLAGGNSLWPQLLGSVTAGARDRGKEVRFAAASSLEGGIFMARSERYKLLWAPRVGAEWGMGQGRGRGRDAELVFDLVNDREERYNLAGEDRLEVAWLRERLLRWVEVGDRLQPGESLDEFDEETLRSLRALGYIQ